MEMLKEYPPGAEEEIAFLYREAHNYWCIVKSECARLPPEAREARIDRAHQELDVIYRRLTHLEQSATLVLVLNREESRRFNFVVTGSSPAEN